MAVIRSRRTEFAVALIAVAGALAALVLGPASPPIGPSVAQWISHTAPVPDRSGWAAQGSPSAPGCRAADLRPAVAGMHISVGELVGSAAVRNAGHGDCTLSGVPIVALVDAHGSSVTATQADDHGQEDATPWQGFPVVSLRPGQTANIRFRWGNGCDPRKTVRVRLAWGAQAIAVPFTFGPLPGYCTFPGQRSYFGVSRWLPAYATSVPVPQAELPIHVRVTAPRRVRPGEHITYRVTLINYAAHAVRFTRCPTYWQGLVDAYPASLRQRRALVLNCRATPVIPPGGRAVYQMRLTIPRHGFTRRDALAWDMIDGPGGTSRITISPTTTDRPKVSL